jgi:hypothetical protein
MAEVRVGCGTNRKQQKRNHHHLYFRTLLYEGG